MLHPSIAQNLTGSFPNTDFYFVYGLTEAAPRVSFLAPRLFGQKDNCAGSPLKSIELGIIGQDGRPVPEGQIGQVVVKGPNVFLGYYRNDEQTARRLRDGWLLTGDMGYVADDGLLHIAGRLDDMIIRAGLNIYPYEIESKLLESDDIREVAVWGEPDPKFGQRIVAEVVLHEGDNRSIQDVHRLCLRLLEPYQLPDRIHIKNQLARNATGKIVRRTVPQHEGDAI